MKFSKRKLKKIYKAPERIIEEYLCKRVCELGGLAIKLNPIRNAGITDRLVLLPNRQILFVELKASGKIPCDLQRFRAGQLMKLGFVCFCVDSKLGVDELLQKNYSSEVLKNEVT